MAPFHPGPPPGEAMEAAGPGRPPMFPPGMAPQMQMAPCEPQGLAVGCLAAGASTVCLSSRYCSSRGGSRQITTSRPAMHGSMCSAHAQCVPDVQGPGACMPAPGAAAGPCRAVLWAHTMHLVPASIMPRHHTTHAPRSLQCSTHAMHRGPAGTCPAGRPLPHRPLAMEQGWPGGPAAGPAGPLPLPGMGPPPGRGAMLPPLGPSAKGFSKGPGGGMARHVATRMCVQ
jgi:hypothetical protein